MTRALITGLILVVFVVPAVLSYSQQGLVDQIRCEGSILENAPRYRIARQMETDKKPGLGIQVSISIAKSAFTREKLSALGCQLSLDFERFKLATVYVFETHTEAKVWAPLGDTNDPRAPAAPRGKYVRYDETGEHSIEWYPKPGPVNVLKDKTVRINLVVPQAKEN